MRTSDYWRERFVQLEAAQNRLAQAGRQEIERHYRRAQRELDEQIRVWYQRLADNNKISLAEARRWLTGQELAEFKWDVQEYIKRGMENGIDGRWAKQLENASARFHISRLEALKIRTRQSMEQLFARQQWIVNQTLADVYRSGYYHTAFELQKGFAVGWDIAAVDQRQLEKVLAKPWVVDGKNFSERIWGNKDKLIAEVHTELTRNIMLGQDPQKAIDAIAKKLNTSRVNAGRLVMTEEAYFSSLAQRDCFAELGVEQFEIVATLDSHTSEICQELDGAVRPMSEFEPGVTAPPFHVNCRSTTVPYFDDEFSLSSERAARGEDGKTYYVPADIKYKDWQQAFVGGGDKSGFEIYDDGSAVHYKKPMPEPPPKKEYLTKKKLQAKIAEADVQLEDLEEQFQNISGLKHDEIISIYGSIDDMAHFEPDVLAKLRDMEKQLQALEAQKVEWQEKLNVKLKAEQKKALVKQQLELEAQKAALQQQLDDFEIKTYSGIWYNKDVTTADWGGLNIAGKKQYYEGKFVTETDPDLLKKYQELYNQLLELDAEGGSYYAVQQQLKQIEAEISKVQAGLQKLENGDTINDISDAFSQERKDAALWAKSTEEADKALRDVCGQVWQDAKPAERRAIYNYTSGSGKFNRPLSGFQDGWGQYNNKGVGKVDLNREGAFKEIQSMTDIISKSNYDIDVWLQRGCGTEAMESFLELPNGVLGNMTQEQLQQFIGRENRIYSFTSTGVAKGTGFSGDVIMNIYVPKGTQMMYAEPFSAFGNGGGKDWDGIVKQSSFGYESEMIIQRGAYYRITKIEKSGRTIFIDLEVHPEQGYQFVEDMPEYTGKR